ncbi:hypothetical protein D9M71_750980 [compost metagenome]
MLNTLGNIARLDRLEGQEDFLVVSPELQRFLPDRPQHRVLTTPIDVFPCSQAILQRLQPPFLVEHMQRIHIQE